jgi:hypothetical protein
MIYKIREKLFNKINGLITFLKSSITIIKQSNNIWKTCISQDNKKNIIYYITPKNVIIKSVDTYQIPKFLVNKNGKKSQFKFQIGKENRYISCFLLIDKEWYAITIIPNSFVYSNRLYYKLNNLFKLYDSGALQLDQHQSITNDVVTVEDKQCSLVSSDMNIYKLLTTDNYQLSNNYPPLCSVANK